MSTDTTALERRAIEFAKLGNFGTDALQINRELAEAAPANQGAWTRLGRCCLELQQYVHLYTPEANELRRRIEKYMVMERMIEREMARRHTY